MNTVLGEHSYGESSVSLILVDRSRPTHRARRFRVDVQLTGGISEVYTHGQNQQLLSTNAISNTIFALGVEHTQAEPEEFALALGRHFLSSSPATETAKIAVTTSEFLPIESERMAFSHSFQHDPSSQAISRVRIQSDGSVALWGGISNLELFKTTDSTFTGFRQDKYLTIRPFTDRVFGASLAAEWLYRSPEIFDKTCRNRAREAILGKFASHVSRSSQNTFYMLAEAVLQACPEVMAARISGAHLTRGLVDLTPFQASNPGLVYTATEHQLSPVTVEALAAAAVELE